MPRAWRILKKKHEKRAFDGEGARLYGGRWTSAGAPVVHVSETLSLATLEVLVHLKAAEPLPRYSVFSVEMPEDVISRVEVDELPANWRAYPSPPANRAIGDRWLTSRASAVLRVPSAIIVHEHNFLIDPRHEDFGRLAFDGPTPFDVDRRVFLGRTGSPARRAP